MTFVNDNNPFAFLDGDEEDVSKILSAAKAEAHKRAAEEAKKLPAEVQPDPKKKVQGQFEPISTKANRIFHPRNVPHNLVYRKVKEPAEGESSEKGDRGDRQSGFRPRQHNNGGFNRNNGNYGHANSYQGNNNNRRVGAGNNNNNRSNNYQGNYNVSRNKNYNNEHGQENSRGFRGGRYNGHGGGDPRRSQTGFNGRSGKDEIQNHNQQSEGVKEDEWIEVKRRGRSGKRSHNGSSTQVSEKDYSVENSSIMQETRSQCSEVVETVNNFDNKGNKADEENASASADVQTGFEKSKESNSEAKNPEGDVKLLTLKEFEKIQSEKKKALESLKKTEQRKVNSDKEFESMIPVGKKMEDAVSIKPISEDKPHKGGHKNEEERHGKKEGKGHKKTISLVEFTGNKPSFQLIGESRRRDNWGRGGENRNPDAFARQRVERANGYDQRQDPNAPQLLEGEKADAVHGQKANNNGPPHPLDSQKPNDGCVEVGSKNAEAGDPQKVNAGVATESEKPNQNNKQQQRGRPFVGGGRRDRVQRFNADGEIVVEKKMVPPRPRFANRRGPPPPPKVEDPNQFPILSLREQLHK